MKKSLLNVGRALKRNEQKQIKEELIGLKENVVMCTVPVVI